MCVCVRVMHAEPGIACWWLNLHADLFVNLCFLFVLQQNRLQWYGHVLRNDDNDWMKKCVECEVEGSRPKGRPKRTLRGVVQKDSQARKLNGDWGMLWIVVDEYG